MPSTARPTAGIGHSCSVVISAMYLPGACGHMVYRCWRLSTERERPNLELLNCFLWKKENELLPTKLVNYTVQIDQHLNSQKLLRIRKITFRPITY